MKVGFFLQGNSAGYIRMAKLMIASVRQTMPGVEVWHLTDAVTPMVDGADGVKRVTEPMPMAVRRMTHNAQLPGEWLFIDCDVIVQKDVRDVFGDKDFDVALTDRDGTITNEAKYAAVMPHNIGVVFSRSPKFWKSVLAYLQKLPSGMQEWEGDQQVVNAMVREGGCGFSIKTLQGLEYNYPPRSADDPRIAEAAIVHYKGNRKTFLLQGGHLIFKDERGEIVEKKACRLCDGQVRPVFKLAPSPLPNSFPLEPDEHAKRFPLELMQCVNCSHVQLRHIVSGLFTDYKYKTPDVPHWAIAARTLRERFPKAKTVLEIGANNAVLLKHLRNNGFTAIGIDPSSDDPVSVKDYFSEATAKNFRIKFDLIVSNNTFAHIDDLQDVFRGIDLVLSEDGAVVFEQMYLVDLIKGGTFDRIYSDHLSQFTLGPLARFLKRSGLVMTEFEYLETHGGSIRVTARRKGEPAILPKEPLEWDRLRDKMKADRERLIGLLRCNQPVVAFGASSKACILFNEFGLAQFISFVVDDTVIKQGRYIPGTALQIKPVSELKGETVLLTAWNYEALIRERLPNSLLINPFPEVECALA